MCISYICKSKILIWKSIQISEYQYDYTEFSGECEFSNHFYDYSIYDYDSHYEYLDYDHTDKDKARCLQSCLQKSKQSVNAKGCFFQTSTGFCVFIKDGTIVGASGDAYAGTCWILHLGNMFWSMNSAK